MWKVWANSSIAALVLALTGYILVGASEAKVPASEAAKLGKELTPLGAIQAANEDGSIPAWEGGITQPPDGYEPGMHHPDPFPGDQPLFTISAENADQYAEHLSPGQKAMLERYPETWRMIVYPTRRSASFSEQVYSAVIANATSATLTEDGNGVQEATLSVGFPIPQSGLEAIWNHFLRYRGKSVRRTYGQATPTAGGSYTMVQIQEDILLIYNTPGETIESINNRLGYFRQSVLAPPRLAGNILLVHETLNQKKEPRKAWVYNPGQRRVRRAPNVAYDNPGTASDAQRTNDQLDMYNGAPDRYDWELVGRREIYVPYNAYKLHSDDIKYDQIVHPGHINPEHGRYELHRVWEVNATLKEGTSHIYARRTFYLDEDSWQILLVDAYDKRGLIWRVSEAHTINYYEIPLVWDTLTCHYDLQNGRYQAFGLNNEGFVEEFNMKMSVSEFTPEALRREGIR